MTLTIPDPDLFTTTTQGAVSSSTQVQKPALSHLPRRKGEPWQWLACWGCPWLTYCHVWPTISNHWNLRKMTFKCVVLVAAINTCLTGDLHIRHRSFLAPCRKWVFSTRSWPHPRPDETPLKKSCWRSSKLVDTSATSLMSWTWRSFTIKSIGCLLYILSK